MARNEFEFGVYFSKDFWPRRSKSDSGFRGNPFLATEWVVLPRGTRPIPQWRPITLKFRGGFPRGFTTTSRILTKDLGAWDLEFSNYWRILAVTYDRSEGLQGGLLKRRNSGSCETTGKWRALLVTFKSQAPVSSQRAPKVCQIRLLCQRETLMGTSTSIVRRKNDEKNDEKGFPKSQEIFAQTT